MERLAGAVSPFLLFTSKANFSKDRNNSVTYFLDSNSTYQRKILNSAVKETKWPGAGPCQPRDSFEQTASAERKHLIVFCWYRCACDYRETDFRLDLPKEIVLKSNRTCIVQLKHVPEENKRSFKLKYRKTLTAKK